MRGSSPPAGQGYYRARYLRFTCTPIRRIICGVQVLNITALERACRKHRDAAGWLRTWLTTAEHATWHNIQDVRRQYPAADGVTLKSGSVVTVFNVRGNTYRLLTLIRYLAQTVTVVDVLTHPEYDKDRWKDQL